MLDDRVVDVSTTRTTVYVMVGLPGTGKTTRTLPAGASVTP
jgi:signal recognition particle GTPase